jgi:nicotinate-nucleotide pyrophosphorylase (carboxylating)
MRCRTPPRRGSPRRCSAAPGSASSRRCTAPTSRWSDRIRRSAASPVLHPAVRRADGRVGVPARETHPAFRHAAGRIRNDPELRGPREVQPRRLPVPPLEARPRARRSSRTSRTSGRSSGRRRGAHLRAASSAACRAAAARRRRPRPRRAGARGGARRRRPRALPRQAELRGRAAQLLGPVPAAQRARRSASSRSRQWPAACPSSRPRRRRAGSGGGRRVRLPCPGRRDRGDGRRRHRRCSPTRTLARVQRRRARRRRAVQRGRVVPRYEPSTRRFSHGERPAAVAPRGRAASCRRRRALHLIDLALEEDRGAGRLDDALDRPARDPRARQHRRQGDGVIAGVALAPPCSCASIRASNSTPSRRRRRRRSRRRRLRLRGPGRAVLTGERTALNFLQRLSGVATLTRRFVEAVEGTGARILDTRKTTPGWRALEKAAVRAGGGDEPSRIGLYDGADQGKPRRHRRRHRRGRHPRARPEQPGLPVIVEVRTADGVRAALASASTGCCSTTWIRHAARRRPCAPRRCVIRGPSSRRPAT